jgi:2'-5' RNA ligase
MPPQIGDVAVIAYLPGELARFLRGLTERLAPGSPHPRPHLTVLPPRPAPSLEAMLNLLHVTAREEPPFLIRMGGLATFLPISEVLFLELESGQEDALHLYQRLQQVFPSDAPRERFRFHPHITLAYGLPRGEVTRLLPSFQEEWIRYPGPREAPLRTLTLVRMSAPSQWDDIASFPLCGHR